MVKITTFFHETRDELKRVAWPSRENVIKHTILVIAVSVGVAVYLGAADFLFTYGLSKILTR